MSRAEQRRPQVGTGQTLQLALWEIASRGQSPDASKRDLTNMVALYDIAPKFSFDTRGDREGSLKLIEREFTFAGKRFRITLKPTQIRGSDGVVVERYLGEREQIVEEVIRRIASNRGRLTVHDGVKVRFPFTIGEVREELKRVKHTYSFAEIREAITLLNEVRLVVQDLETRGSPVLSSAAFPVMGLRQRGDDFDSFVEFNPLVADAIRLLDFLQVDYDTLMEIRDPVARWLLKRLHNEIAATRQPIQQITATDIRRDSGMPEWKTTRNLLRRVLQAVDVLVAKGVLDKVDADEVLEGQRKVDIVFTVSASPDFMAKVHASNRAAKMNQDDFERLSGGRSPAEGFARVGAAEVFRLRDARAPAAPEAEEAA
ncbi:hypothetical protein NF552_22540 (plasmid) [Roseomonas mucosa]|nr:hypothetical protein NF552_22540 [Roseomonas mucosa]